MDESIYATPCIVDDPSICSFYHRMDVPGYPEAGHGSVDLRAGIDQYLGHVDLKGKRVLEIGTTDGYICFHMEAQGAEVVAYDLSEREEWDIVPFDGHVSQDEAEGRREHIRRLNNAFWLSHRAFGSQAKMVYGTVYAIPPEIGAVDVTVVGAVLVHLRDPFLALQNALRLTRETVIISDTTLMRWFNPLRLAPSLVGPYAMFLPRPDRREQIHSWWLLTPALVRRFVEVLGFEQVRLRYHYQTYHGRRYYHYTLVAHRTRGQVAAESDSRSSSI